jgi:hypothetical protein
MRLRHALIAAAGVAMLGFAMPSQAAPVGALDGLRNATENETVQQVHRRYRKYRHYRHHRRYYGYGPGVQFYIGPSRRHHHHYRRHHW